jgi:hypothetical protein
MRNPPGGAAPRDLKIQLARNRARDEGGTRVAGFGSPAVPESGHGDEIEEMPKLNNRGVEEGTAIPLDVILLIDLNTLASRPELAAEVPRGELRASGQGRQLVSRRLIR